MKFIAQVLALLLFVVSGAQAAGPFVKLQLLMPGETAAPGTGSGKTGTPSAQTAGTNFSIRVNAVDATWNVVTSVVDFVSITSTDPNATLPSSAALVDGTRVFSMAFNTAGGTRTVTATNLTDSTKTANTSPATTVNAGTFVKLQLLMPGETAAPGTPIGKTGAPTTRTAGTGYTATVRAVDANWNLVSSTHVVGLSSTDSHATLPPNLALAAGSRIFSLTNRTVGAWTQAATDITDGTKIPNSSPATTVTVGALAKLQILVPGETADPGSTTGKTGTPTVETAGVAFNATVNAVDANWNLYNTNHTVRITSTDTNATLPANAALVAGTQVFSVALKTAGSWSVTATNVTDGTKTANTSSLIAVAPNTATAVRVETLANGAGTVVPARTITSGDTVTGFSILRDAYGNFVTNAAPDAWLLNNISGSVDNGDLVPAGDGKSAVFTGLGDGSANLHADVASLVSTDSGTVTVNPVPGLSVSDVAVTETAGIVNAIFTISMSATSTLATTFNASTSNGTAVAGSDYVATNRTFIIPPGGTSTTLTVRVTGDTTHEANETYFVILGGLVNATNSNGIGVGTINNDDVAPTMSVGDVIVVEGNTGTTNAIFRVTLSAASGLPATFNFASSNGNATVAGNDYVAASGGGSVPIGLTSTTFAIAVNGDRLYESNEFFNVLLSNPGEATISDGLGNGAIFNDDAIPLITLHQAPFDNQETPDQTPAFEFTGVDSDTNADDMVYQIQWSLDHTFAAGVTTRNSETNTGFLNTVNGGDASPFTKGQKIQYSIQAADALANNAPDQAYYWRVRARETQGNGISDFGDWSAVRSLRVNSALSHPQWTQTTDTQFFTDTFNDTRPNQSNGVDIAGNFVRSVEYVEITMATGVTNATVLLSQHQTTSNCVPFASAMDSGSGGDFDSLMPDVYFEAGPKVTAIRRSGVGTLTVGVTVVEFEPTAVRVQQGTMDLSGISGTRPISPVDRTKTALVFYYKSPETGDHYRRALVDAFFSATNQITFERKVADRNMTGHYYVFEALGSQYSVQATNFSLLAGSIQAVATITSVSTNATFLIASYSTTHPNSNPNDANVSIFLSSPTQITAERYRGNDVMDIRVFAVTFSSEGLVQRGGGTYAAADVQQSATIAPVDLRTSMAWGNMVPPGIMPLNIANSGNARGYQKIKLLNATTVRGNRAQSGTAARDRWEVVTWPVPHKTAGTAATPPIPFTLVPAMDGWGDLVFSNDLNAGEINFDIQYWDGATWLNTPITNQTVSPVDLTSLDPFNVHTQLRVYASFSTADLSPTLQDWAVRWEGEAAISIEDVTVTEGDAGTVDAVFAVTLSNPTALPVSVNFSTSNGTAEAGSDYDAISGTLTFDAQATSTTLTVVVHGDTATELTDENFTLQLANPTNAIIADGIGVGTILEDEISRVSIGDATVTEGSTGTVAAVFAITLSSPSVSIVTVNYATSNGTATAGSDFAGTSGTITFNPGMTSTSITVVVNGDTTYEVDDELFTVELSNPVNVGIDDLTGLGRIVEDDPQPAIAVGDSAVAEGNAGTTDAVFSVTLSNPSIEAVSVTYSTVEAGAAADSDYVTGGGVLTFDPGMTSTTLIVVVTGDTLYEVTNEIFTVELSDPFNAALSDGSGEGTIIEDDTPPVIAIGNVTVAEGDAGTVAAVFNVTLSIPSVQSVSATLVTSNGTANAGSDYLAAGGIVTFDPGETSTTLVVTVNSDTLYESTDETFFVLLTGPANGSLGDGVGLGTITEDDAQPTVTIGNATVTEGDIGTVGAVFTVSLSNPSAQLISVDYATSNGTAAAGADYLGAAGTVSVPPGALSTTLTVVVNSDTLYEVTNELFTVELANAVNASFSDASGLGTITEDDGQPQISIGDVTVGEGNAGGVDAVFTVSLSNPSIEAISVDYVTSNGTAVAGSDYTAAGDTLTFNPGMSSTTLTVVVIGDLVDEASESFSVELSGPVNGGVLDGQGLGNITDDDTAALSISDASVSEGNTGTTAMVFTVSLSIASATTITVDYGTSNETALAGSDYVTANGTLTIIAGTLSTNITVAVIGDLVDESNETFTVTLSNPANATLGDAQGQGTILDDDVQQVIVIGAIERVTGSIKISWPGIEGLSYTVQHAPSLIPPPVAWTNLAGYVGIPGSNGTMQATNSIPGVTNRFYRVLGNPVGP